MYSALFYPQRLLRQMASNERCTLPLGPIIFSFYIQNSLLSDRKMKILFNIIVASLRR